MAKSSSLSPTSLPSELMEALAAVWRMRPPGPLLDNFLSDPRFTRLRDTCYRLYPKGGPKGPFDIALYIALRALGLHLRLPAKVATAWLDAAFRRTHVSRVHLCPLDLEADRK
jgi:hypothetical protein